MSSNSTSAAKELFRVEWKQLAANDQQVINTVHHRTGGSRNRNKQFEDRRIFGEQASELIAKFDDSWTKRNNMPIEYENRCIRLVHSTV